MPKKPATKKRGRQGEGGGPKPRKIDYEEVEKLARILCTDAEIAEILEYTPEGFRLRKNRDSKLLGVLLKGRATGKKSLRRIQWELAQNGSAAMAIFLGKNFLGQKDRHDITITDYRRMAEEIAEREGLDADELMREAEEIARTMH